MPKIISKFVIRFKRHTERDPIFMSIKGGMVAAKLWGDGEPNIMVKGGRYACSEIESIEPVYMRGYHAEQQLKMGSAITDDQLEQVMQGEGSLPQLSE